MKPLDRTVDSRTVGWGGLHNARDLGGLPVGDSGTQFGRFFRTPRLDDLAADGWQEMVDAGVRTIIDLRNDDEVSPLPIPDSITRHAHPIEDQSDAEFMAAWGRSLGSPIYYTANLQRWPQRVVQVFQTFADAPEGGIVFHCSAGRDRTGLVTALLLQLAGADDAVIVNDYVLSVVAMNDYFTRVDHPHERPKSGADLDEWVREVASHLRDFLGAVSTEQFLRDNGMSAQAIDGIRSRLVDA